MLFQTMLHHPMLKICVALIKEKCFASFRHRVTMMTIWTIRTMIWLHPIHCKISVPKYNCLRITPCWSLCADLCDSLREVGKVPASGLQGLNRGFRREFFSKYATPPYAQKLRCIKQRKGLCFIQASSDDEDDKDDDMIFSYSWLPYRFIRYS